MVRSMIRSFAIPATIMLVGMSATSTALAAEGEIVEAPAIEEVVVVGKFLNVAQQLLNERREEDSVIDVLDTESISRLGDSTVANAMRRMTGVSLVGGKFVYVRGLGERYSSTTLNGAAIPSPDLTRNVIPLDIFPASIVSGLSVQKTFSPDIRANFAGGLIDVRTTAFPEKGNNFSIEIGSGDNSANKGTLYSYAGGSDDSWGTDDGTRALPEGLLGAIDTYKGNLSPATILADLRAQDSGATFEDAQAINRQLALNLNRNVALRPANDEIDKSIRLSAGTNVSLSDNLEFGVQLSGGYDATWRKRSRVAYNRADPEERFSKESRTTHSTNLNGVVTAGLAYTFDHEISVGRIFIRNTDDEALVDNFFNENRVKSDGIGFSKFGVEFEQKELKVLQYRGEHTYGFDTQERLPFLSFLPDESTLSWHYTDSSATTDIPNAVTVNTDTETDPITGQVLSTVIQRDTSAADFRFTDLKDDVLSYGYVANLPFEWNRVRLTARFGYQYDRKVRQYAQREFGLGSVNSIVGGSFNDVFSDSNILDPDNAFELRIQGSGSRSYLAATATTSTFGMGDLWINDTYRVTAGIRREDYIQVALPWNLYGYSIESPQISMDLETLERASFEESSYFPSLTLGYVGEFWAEEFQVRLGWSQTAIRPDLREVSESSYVDPITDELTFGNPDVIPSEIDNYDLRLDWIWDSGNSLTVGGFYKDISDPIEFYETPASDTNRARGIINAESSELVGVELEGLLRLSFLGELGDLFFLQGNATLQDSETTAGERADAPTNERRPAAGASDYLVNLTIGFDSLEGNHTASLIYNVFGKRLYRAGRLGAPDEFEQPFHSLDLTYSWYPTETLTLKAKVQNILGQTTKINSGDILVYEREPGTSVSLKVKYEL